MAIIEQDRQIGRQIAGQPVGNEAHFMQCEFCGEEFDCRNLGEVLVHEGHAHALLRRKPPAPST
jgi:hypothetical protein